VSVFQVRRAVAASTLALALGSLSACGSSSDDSAAASSSPPSSASSPSSSSSSSAASTSSSSAAAVAPQAQSLAVTSVDFDFEMPSTDLTAGDYTITLTNNGHATHDLVVEQNGADVAKSDSIGPGQSSTFTVTLQPGSYVFYCSIGNHRQMGMEVDVTVS
jgi:plastocyanin